MEAFTYTYWFIIKDMTKDTGGQTIEEVDKARYKEWASKPSLGIPPS